MAYPLKVLIISHPCQVAPSAFPSKFVRVDHRFICIVKVDARDYSNNDNWQTGMMLTNTTSGTSKIYSMAIRTWAEHCDETNRNTKAEKASVVDIVGFLSPQIEGCGNPRDACKWLYDRLTLPDEYYASIISAWGPTWAVGARMDCHAVGEVTKQLFATYAKTPLTERCRGKMVITKEDARNIPMASPSADRVVL